MEQRIAEWVQRETGTPVREVLPVAVGLGDTELWRVHRAPETGDLLVRRFAFGAEATARREMAAMRAAHAHGVPVPMVLACDVLDERPFLLTGWCDGQTASEAIATSPASARSIGMLLGETLGTIHRVPAPEGLASADAWITRGGPALTRLRSRLDAVPNADRLLHLDFHPLNVMIAAGKMTGVIDWTNTMTGPPHMDLARSRAILRAVSRGMTMTSVRREGLTAYEAGLVEGHARVAGSDPHPALSAAWGLAMTVDDLAGHLGKPGVWVTPGFLETLRDERNALIAAALGEGA